MWMNSYMVVLVTVCGVLMNRVLAKKSCITCHGENICEPT